MAIVLFICYLFLCVAVFGLFLYIFKNRYTNYYKIDEVIDSDDETYTIFLPEERWREYVKEYVVYSNDDDRFLKLELTDKIEYIDINIVCYKDKKIKKIISFLNEVDVKKDHFLIKLPDNIDEVKLNVVEVNGNTFPQESLVNQKVLVPAIVSSLLLGISATLLLYIFRLLTINLVNSYFDWEYIYAKLWYEPYIYLIVACTTAVISLLIFLCLFIPNSIKINRAKFNKIKKLNISKLLKFRLKIVKKKDFNLCYLLLKKKRKYKFKEGRVVVSCFDENDNHLGDVETGIYKNRRKYYLKFKNISRVETKVIFASFKKYYYKNGVFRKKLEKKGVVCGFLRLNGVKKAKNVFLVSVILISAFGIYKYYQFSQINSDLSKFKFEYSDSSESSYTIAKYDGTASKVVIPRTFNDLPIVRISEGAFSENLYIDEVYFTGEIDIDRYAFSNCFNLKKVDLTNVDTVGYHAFSASRIREVIIDNDITISEGAFYNNSFLRKVILKEGANASILNGAFAATEIDYLEVHAEGNDVQYGAFSGAKVGKGYIYRGGGITENNYTSFVSPSDSVKFENDCVHDNHSFIVQNGFIKDEKSFKVYSVIQKATCVSTGVNDVICNYCGKHYQSGSPVDKVNGHEYLDGECIHCGKADPNYVPPVEEGDETNA